MIEYLIPLFVRELAPLVNNSWGVLAIALIILVYFRNSLVELLPSVLLQDHDIYSRLMIVWVSRYRPDLSSYKANLFGNPSTLAMARYFTIQGDPVEFDQNEMFYFPERPTLFRYKNQLFIVQFSPMKIYAVWYDNKPVQDFLFETVNKYLIKDRLQQYTTQGGQWVLQPRPKRPKETYHFKDLDWLLKIATDFFSEEKKFVTQGQKWKYVFLFHGAPGTGKTSLGDVIASETGVPLYRLATGSSDEEFRQLIAGIKEKSITILDEIDQLNAALEGGDTSEGSQRPPIKKQTLQSWLSGELGNPGVIIILTTNHYDKLDKVLRRSQRVDKKLSFPGEITKEAVIKIIKRRYPEKSIQLPGDIYAVCPTTK